ncbi:MAG: hypothetical protein HW377_1815 [Actinobacteria bacterium]|nr:hypothetical protein [Actinomycetota bacterium]MBM2828698.1 hypothetical protein [Actinomycetota bacterium]
MSVPANRFRPRPSYTSIVGLSTTMRMPRLGKIRLGIKVKNAKGVEYPKDVDYFVCPPEVQEIYGEKPKELDVLIPSTDPALYFPQALKWYKGARLVCKGNGETATRINTETGNMFEMACPCEHLKDPQTNPKGECTARANLMVILPKVSMGGAYQIDTGSNNNIINLNSTMNWILSMIGRVAWVPLTLKRVPTKIQTPDGTTTKALLQLEFKGNVQDAAALRHADWISIQGGSVPAALPPHVEDDDGPGDVTAEVVDEATGEVIDALPATATVAPATPVVAETPPAEDEVPFPEPKQPPPAEPSKAAPAAPKDPITELVEGRTLLLSAAGTKAILAAVWSEIVKDTRIPGVDKAKLQVIYDRKKKEMGA